MKIQFFNHEGCQQPPPKQKQCCLKVHFSKTGPPWKQTAIPFPLHKYLESVRHMLGREQGGGKPSQSMFHLPVSIFGSQLTTLVIEKFNFSVLN